MEAVLKFENGDEIIPDGSPVKIRVCWKGKEAFAQGYNGFWDAEHNDWICDSCAGVTRDEHGYIID